MQIVNPQILIDIQNLHIQIHFQHDVSFMNITNYIPLWCVGGWKILILCFEILTRLNIQLYFSLAVSGLLKYYLSSLQITSELIFGVLLWDEAARSGPDDFEGTPHVWLNLENDIPIDNNYVAFPPNADNLEYFYECKKMNAYCKEDPLQTSLKLYLGLDEDAEAKEVVRHNLRIMQIYSKSSNIMKYLAISLKHAELNPGVKMYHILMQV